MILPLVGHGTVVIGLGVAATRHWCANRDMPSFLMHAWENHEIRYPVPFCYLFDRALEDLNMPDAPCVVMS